MVLVTGATGILGRVIVLELLKRGKTVRATHRKNSDLAEVENSFKFYTDTPELFFKKIDWVLVDFDDIFSLQTALQNVTEVYQCAAKVGFHPKDRQEIYHTNVEGTKNLLYSCENSSVRKFCFVSSIAVFDSTGGAAQITEQAEYNAKLPHSTYATSKHFSEMEVWRATAEGLKTVIINPGVIIGSGNWKSSSGEIFETFRKYPLAMSGSSNYVDVRDVAKIAVTLMANEIFGERFILVSERKKFGDVANLVRQKFGKKAAKIVPKWLLQVGFVLNPVFGWLFPALRLFTKVNIEAVTSAHRVSNQKIKDRLNYDFIPIDESLDFHLNNYISDYYTH